MLRNVQPTARKEHKCEYCGGIIHVGEKYDRQTNVFDGHIYDWICHIECTQLACELDMFDGCYDGLDGDAFIDTLSRTCEKSIRRTERRLIWKGTESYEEKGITVVSP